MKKVLIPTKLDGIAKSLLKENGYNVIQDSEKAIEDLVKENADTQVLIVRSEKVTQEILDALPELKLIVRAGAGFNTIDIKHARRKDVDVMNTPGANSNAVAEEVVAFMLASYRHLLKGDASTRAGLWEKKKLMGHELTGKTIGIIGMGNIGRLVKKRLSGFEMNFLAYDPMLSSDLAEKLDVKLSSMEEIFEKSEFVSLHIPETKETKEMINADFFKLMKPDAVLINCARAGIINEEDLREAKKTKNIIFCNDVYAKDAPGEKSVKDIADIMLPHLGASTVEANFNAAEKAAVQIIDYFEKGISNCVVNKGVPDGLDARFQELAFVLAKLANAYLGNDSSANQIETSFYGALKPFSKWMLPPIVAGITSGSELYMDTSDAEEILQERDITLVNREADDSKKYGESMTIDLIDNKNIKKASIRGTVAENNLMITRINDFNKLFLEASGNNLIVEYSDAPGVIGKIASMLGEHQINIIDIRAPQNLTADKALAVIKTNIVVSNEIIKKIDSEVNAVNAFSVSF
jgi:D-3-phosphoglycerate dehydrogenase